MSQESDSPAPVDRLPKAQHREVSRRVREARDRLTSTTGTRPAFDYELLRQYAQNRLSASAALILMIISVGALSGLWTNALRASVWTAVALLIHLVLATQCRRFLDSAPGGLRLGNWQARLVVLETLLGFVWMLSVAQFVGGDGRAAMFMLFVMLLTFTMSSMLASSLPVAMLGATMPVTSAVVVDFLLKADMNGYFLAAMAATAQVYFTALSHRLHATTLATLQARAEKDALIAELEQEKAGFDEARRRAEAASLAKSRFLAQMSHELRTPLNAILGFSEVMKSEIFGPHAVPTYKEYSGDIHNSGVHLLNLINEILDLSRIEAGRYELNEEAVSLVDLAEECHHLLKLRAKNRGITIHEAYESELPKLWADERAVRQICLNLLSNAIKFTPQNGEIWITVGWTSSGGQYYKIRDSGPGIPEHEIPIVLASFGQGTNAIKSAEQGTGLGLPIVKSMIDLHGGTFVLNSKLREGTEVIVTFPPERIMAGLGPLEDEAPPLVPEPEASKGGRPVPFWASKLRAR